MSRFLGSIQNDIDTTYNGKSWKSCNVEYEITINFKRGLFLPKTNVVKFHGSVALHTGLPIIVSLL